MRHVCQLMYMEMCRIAIHGSLCCTFQLRGGRYAEVRHTAITHMDVGCEDNAGSGYLSLALCVVFFSLGGGGYAEVRHTAIHGSL